MSVYTPGTSAATSAELNVTGSANVTTGSQDWYVDGTSGDDSNSGLTVGSPFKTLDAAINKIPHIVRHNIAIHLTGTLSLSTNVTISKNLQDGKFLIIDGGTQVDVHDNNGGSMFTADITSNNTIGVSSGPFSDNSYSGYWAKIDSGTGSGQTRLIYKASDTTLFVTPNWKTNPDGTSKFHIVKPHTKITGGGDIIFNNMNSPSACGVQHILFSGSSLFSRNASNIIASNLIFDTNGTAFQISEFAKASLLDYSYDVSTFSLSSLFVSSGKDLRAGVSSIHSSGRVEFRNSECQGIAGSYFRNELSMNSSYMSPNSFFGNRIKGSLVLRNTGMTQRGNGGFFDSLIAGLVPCPINLIDNSSDIGIQIIGCNFIPFENNSVAISDCTNHGIEVFSSYVKFLGSVSGSGNAKSGLWAHGGSVVEVKNGTVPSLTGSVAEIVVANTGSSAAGWSDLDNGGVLAVSDEMTVLKGV